MCVKLLPYLSQHEARCLRLAQGFGPVDAAHEWRQSRTGRVVVGEHCVIAVGVKVARSRQQIISQNERQHLFFHCAAQGFWIRVPEQLEPLVLWWVYCSLVVQPVVGGGRGRLVTA